MCVITIIYDSILQGQRCRADSILQNFSLWIEIRERRSLLYVRHHGRIAHTKAAVGPAATAPIRQHGEEGVFVDRVLTLADTFRGIFIDGTEAVVGFRA